MINMKNQKDYKKIFEEYRELEAKTFIGVSEHVLGKEIDSVRIIPEDLIRVDKLREELKKRLEFLTDDQLKSLYNDDDTSLVVGAVKIVAKRGLGKERHEVDKKVEGFIKELKY